MTEIYFVRHAQPDLNVSNNYTRPLTEIGRKDAHKLCEFLKDIKFAAFYSSTYLRSYETILELASYQNKKIIKIENLKERLYGKRKDKIEDFFKKQWNDFSYKNEDGESLNDVIFRNVNEINKLLKKHANERILIGYHGTNLCALLSYYTSNFNYYNFLEIKPLLPLVVKMVFDNDKFVDYEMIYSVKRDYLDIEKLI